MIEKCDRLIEIVNNHTIKEIKSNYIFSDSIQYEFEKLYEDTTRLSVEFRMAYKDELNIDDLRSIRNRVAHDYESVVIDVLIDTIQNNIPIYKKGLETFLETIEQE